MNYEQLKSNIRQYIRENGNEEITGEILQDVLIDMVNNLAEYKYMGIATPSTNPVVGDTNLLYIASTAGTYSHMGNIALAPYEVAILRYKTSWVKDTICYRGGGIVQGYLYHGVFYEEDTHVHVIPENATTLYLDMTDGELMQPYSWVEGEYVKLGDVKKVAGVAEGAIKLDQNSFYISDSTEESITLHLEYETTEGTQSLEVVIEKADYGLAGLMTPQDKEDIDTLKSEVSQLSRKVDELDVRIFGRGIVEYTHSLIKYQNIPVSYPSGTIINSILFTSSYLQLKKGDGSSDFATIIDANGSQVGNQINAENLSLYAFPLTLQDDVIFFRSGESQEVTITLSAIDGEIDKKVDKVIGKGLSTNDFDNFYKSTLDGYMGTYRRISIAYTPLTPFIDQEVDSIPSTAKITDVLISDNGYLELKDENHEVLTITSADGVIVNKINGTNFNLGLLPLPLTISGSVKYIRLGGTPTDNNVRIVAELGEYGDKHYVDSIKTLELNTNVNLEKFGNVGKIPMATWVDDDAVILLNGKGVHSIVKPICEDLGIKPTIACIPTQTTYVIDDEEITQQNYLKARQREGYHITAHPNHTGWYGSGYDFSLVEPSLIDTLTTLQGNGFLHSDMLIYPGSSSEIQEVINVVKRWCICAVRAGLGNPNHLGDSTKWQIKRTFIDFEACYNTYHSTTGFISSLQWYKDKIDDAYAHGDWIIFGTHSSLVEPSDDTSNPNVTTRGNVKALIQYTQSKMNFYTLWDAWNRRKILFDINEFCLTPK